MIIDNVYFRFGVLHSSVKFIGRKREDIFILFYYSYGERHIIDLKPSRFAKWL